MIPIPRFACAALAALLLPVSGYAQHFLINQIGDTSGTTPQFSDSRLSQFFPDFPTTPIAAIDDFFAGSYELNLVNVTGAFNSINAGGYLNITNYRVEIYSSLAAAGNALAGDILSLSVPVGAVTLTPYTHFPNQNDMLVSIPLNFALPGAGTYWISIIPVAPSADGFFVYDSSEPGNLNSVQSDIGGNFGPPNSVYANNTNLALSVTAVPEPGTVLAGLGALGVVGTMLVRRRRQRGV